jgi:hypothetical protein
VGYNLELDIDYFLPIPSDEELNLGLKMDYFDRLLELNLDGKYKISKEELYNWIHHNYSSVFLTNEELSLLKYRKLQK